MDPGTAAAASAGFNAIASGKGGGGEIDRDLLVPQEPQLTEIFKRLYPIILAQLAQAAERQQFMVPYEQKAMQRLGQEFGNDRTQADIDRVRTEEMMTANKAAQMAQAIATGQGLGPGFTAGAKLQAQNRATENVNQATRQFTDPKYRIGQMMNAITGMNSFTNPNSVLAYLGPLLQVQGALKPGAYQQGGGVDPLAAGIGSAMAGIDWGSLFPSGGGGNSNQYSSPIGPLPFDPRSITGSFG